MNEIRFLPGPRNNSHVSPINWHRLPHLIVVPITDRTFIVLSLRFMIDSSLLQYTIIDHKALITFVIFFSKQRWGQHLTWAWCWFEPTVWADLLSRKLLLSNHYGFSFVCKGLQHEKIKKFVFGDPSNLLYSSLSFRPRPSAWKMSELFRKWRQATGFHNFRMFCNCAGAHFFARVMGAN